MADMKYNGELFLSCHCCGGILVTEYTERGLFFRAKKDISLDRKSKQDSGFDFQMIQRLSIFRYVDSINFSFAENSKEVLLLKALSPGL